MTVESPFVEWFGVDAMLDAVALVEARMRRDAVAADAIANARGDAEHWRSVAGTLSTALGELLADLGDDERAADWLADVRQVALGHGQETSESPL